MKALEESMGKTQLDRRGGTSHPILPRDQKDAGERTVRDFVPSPRTSKEKGSFLRRNLAGSYEIVWDWSH